MQQLDVSQLNGGGASCGAPMWESGSLRMIPKVVETPHGNGSSPFPSDLSVNSMLTHSTASASVSRRDSTAATGGGRSLELARSVSRSGQAPPQRRVLPIAAQQRDVLASLPPAPTKDAIAECRQIVEFGNSACEVAENSGGTMPAETVHQVGGVGEGGGETIPGCSDSDDPPAEETRADFGCDAEITKKDAPSSGDDLPTRGGQEATAEGNDGASKGTTENKLLKKKRGAEALSGNTSGATKRRKTKGTVEVKQVTTATRKSRRAITHTEKVVSEIGIVLRKGFMDANV